MGAEGWFGLIYGKGGKGERGKGFSGRGVWGYSYLGGDLGAGSV